MFHLLLNVAEVRLRSSPPSAAGDLTSQDLEVRRRVLQSLGLHKVLITSLLAAESRQGLFKEDLASLVNGVHLFFTQMQRKKLEKGTLIVPNWNVWAKELLTNGLPPCELPYCEVARLPDL